MNCQTLLLSKEDIQKCLDMPNALRIVEQVFCAHGKGTAVMPAKLKMTMERMGGWLNAMPAYLETMGTAGLKWAGRWEKNPERGLSYIMATILLIDPQTGLLLSVMEGGCITDIRTGAATALSAKFLARKDSKVLGLIGAGAQGRMQLRALSEVMPLEEVKVMDIRPEVAIRFVQDMKDVVKVPLKSVKTRQEAAEGADIIVTVTSGEGTFVRKEWVSKGAFISSVGSYPELDPELIFSSKKVLVDSWAQNQHRGELSRLVQQGKFTERDLYGEIGEVVSRRKPGRESKDETIVVCLIGMGSHDVGCAHFVYQEALKKGLGTPFDFKQIQ